MNTVFQNHIRNRVNTKVLLITVAIIALVGISYAGYSYMKNRSDEQKVPVVVRGSDASSIIERVSKLTDLPKTETPVIATINQAERVKTTQPFYANVENGDLLLLFPGKELAILYSPTKDKIINIGSIEQAKSSKPIIQP